MFGNVRDGPIQSSVSKVLESAIAHDIRDGVEKCRGECEYFPICGGGYPSNKIWENGSFATTDTMQCELGVKALADVAVEVFASSVSV